MEANELRIGNIYHSVKFNTDIWLTLYDFSQLESMCDGAELTPEIIMQMITPIPLTEEWLIRFGFKAHEKKKWLLQIEFSMFKLTYHLNCNRMSMRGAGCYDLNINTVHQLQNLHFALTGKELELN